MQLVEQHMIAANDPRYQAIDRAAFASKNLYNLANSHVRQSFIFAGKYLGFAELLVEHLNNRISSGQAAFLGLARPDFLPFLPFVLALGGLFRFSG